MKRNLKAEINNLINERMSEIQSQFVEGKLTDEGREIITVLTNECLNLVRRHELDYRDLDSECFSYDGKGVPLFGEDKYTEFISSTIYLKLKDVSKKDKSCFLGLNQYDNDAMYNWKRKDCSRFIRYVENFSEDGEGLEPLSLNPDELYAVCTRKTVNFENLFHYYENKTDDDVLKTVVKILFNEKFHRCSIETQQFLIDYCKKELHARALSRTQHTRIDDFINGKIRYTACDRSLQMLLSKIIENDIKK